MEDINLHFTGDFHAIGSAHNLLSALLDNHIYWGNSLDIEARRTSWRRVIDLNDRALRSIVGSLGGVANGFAREDGFDITAASEVMAVFCLAESLGDLKERLGDIIVAETRGRQPVFARDLMGPGPMTALLKEAILPNIVQTLEKTPAFVHGGPFANIAHGCNSVMATRTALKLADYTVTEAGFGSDLGGEKFIDIKCRKAGFEPDAAVLVATVRALKMHGGVARDAFGAENIAAIREGVANLKRHIENIQSFGVPVVVALNHFNADTADERLSCMSSVLPIGLVSDDGIEDGKQFAHDGGQGDFLWFAEFEEVVIEALEDRIVPGGGQRGHVEGGTNFGATAPDGAPAAHHLN